MSIDVIARVREATAGSEFLRAVELVNRDGGRQFALGSVRVRPLYPQEVARLEALGNTADDWSQVQVADGFDSRRVRGTAFHGRVILGRFDGRRSVAGRRELPAGVTNSTLADCVIGHDALVRDVKLLAGYAVGAGAVLLDCGTIVHEPGSPFGNGEVIPVALEGGGRDVTAYAELDVETAATVARRRADREWLRAYEAAAAAYRARAESTWGVIGPGAVVRSTPALRNSYLGPGAVVDGATLVSDSTLLSREDEPVTVSAGACVSRSLVQWGSRVSTLAVVERSVLAEHVHVERHGKVTDSFLGPNTAVAAGEVTSCLLGPFVACHHQSLLISAFWPGGRGNVAYGANVGSNHTSRAPDQEFWAGEGMFLGLGVNVKFPADFSRAPYTVVACGAMLLPQRVTFPFALVAPPAAQHPGVSPALNEIQPGWVLAENLYALRRNEAKHRARNRAKRARFDFRVLRPETVDLMRDACRRLEDVRERKDFYTERDIDGLGKNLLLERHRLQGIDAYRFATRCYALLGLLDRVRAALAGDEGGYDRLLAAPSDDAGWEHQRRILVDDLAVPDVAAGLREVPGVLEAVARAVERAKVKDETRGARVIEDYADVHTPAGQDAWVRQTWDETRRLQAEAASLAAALATRTAPAREDPAPAHERNGLPQWPKRPPVAVAELAETLALPAAG